MSESAPDVRHGAFLRKNEAVVSELGPIALDLVSSLSNQPSLHRSGLGEKIDVLTVREGRTAIVEIEKEFGRLERYREALEQTRDRIRESLR